MGGKSNTVSIIELPLNVRLAITFAVNTLTIKVVISIESLTGDQKISFNVILRDLKIRIFLESLKLLLIAYIQKNNFASSGFLLSFELPNG
jgi:hypothetical protein